MNFLNPAGLWLAALALPILALHVLRPRRESTEVSSTFLWRQVERPVSAAAPWQRLRPSLLLFLQLLAVFLLTMAVANPVIERDTGLAEHTVFIVDSSGSMAAIDGSPDRLALAKEAAKELRRGIPDGGTASIVVAGNPSRVLLTNSPDSSAFDRALGPIETQAGTPDFAGAFTLAESLETANVGIGFVLLSDGGINDVSRKLIPPGTQHEVIGERATNRAITRLAVEPRGAGLFTRVSVANTGGAAATQTLRLDVDGVTVSTVELELAPGETIVHETELPGGEQVVALLEGEDLLDIDDRAYAVAPRRRELSVLHIGPRNIFLEDLLSAIDGISVTRAETVPVTEDFDADHDIVVYDRVAVPDEPKSPFLAIAPPGGVPGVAVTGEIEQPIVVLIDDNDPLLQGLDLTEVGIAKSQQIDSTTNEVLLGGVNAPLLLRGQVEGQRFAYLSFALADSNLPIQVAFPVLGDRILSDLAGAALPSGAIVVGERLPTDVPGATVVTEPGGDTYELTAGSVAPVATRPGFWTVETEGLATRTIAANPSPAESTLEPTARIATEPRAQRAGAQTGVSKESYLWLVGLVLLAILVAEYLAARRKIGVSKSQWRLAQIGRVLVGALVIAGMIGPSMSRPANRVATLFLVDASDSLGRAGKTEATDWVAEALKSADGDDIGGVALFGGDSRIELPLGEDARLDGVSVRVDSSKTDLESALRLGGAILPADAKRRIVIVSDGRVNSGDESEEAAALRDLGVQVDVHTLTRPAQADVAVSELQAPTTARDGELIKIEGIIEATGAGPVELTLRRDGEVVERRTVQVEAGKNTVEFEQAAGENGLARFQLDAVSPGDQISENDTGFAGVQVEGAARVLLAEGRSGEGEVLADALRAGGVEVVTIDADRIPALDELATYAATVLVNVDERDLSNRQVDSLAAATRDLGHGLVTIGGTKSFGTGAYRESELEEILPVISEVVDPLRRQSVAEVLAIDTSGSMGACHCAEDGAVGGMGDEGGVNKTDISRAAAARAIDALSSNDEVGVLAFDSSERWVIDLQTKPSDDLVRQGLRTLRPDGGTNISNSLQTAAEALRKSDASLKHIILFTDGFTEPFTMNGLAGEAADLLAEGITVSVVGTGEGSARELERIADAGGGRYYPGRDLEAIPEIIAEETITASRSFINEGSFFPKITANSQILEGIDAAPPILGYTATTSKATARTLMRIGDGDDPLLATIQVGLGTSTAWTSDASNRWLQQWASWDGYVDFWTKVVKDTFPAGDANGAVRSSVSDGTLTIRVEAETAWADGSTAMARITGPDLDGEQIQLERVSDTEFIAELPVDDAGSYAVGVQVETPEGTALTASSLASQSYSAEYRPGAAEPERLELISDMTEGRGEIEAAMAFDEADLETGKRIYELGLWFLLAAALLWPLAVALSRLSFSGVSAVRSDPKGAADSAKSWVRDLMPSGPSEDLAGNGQPGTPVQGQAPQAGSPPPPRPPSPLGPPGPPRPPAPPRPGPAPPRHPGQPGAWTMPTQPPTGSGGQPVDPRPAPPTPPRPPKPGHDPRPAPPGSGTGGSTFDQLLDRKRRPQE